LPLTPKDDGGGSSRYYLRDCDRLNTMTELGNATQSQEREKARKEQPADISLAPDLCRLRQRSRGIHTGTVGGNEADGTHKRLA
jgi:hypothetical protein